MDAFSYLSVLLSIILGLAITQVLQGVRGLLLSRQHVTLYAPTLIWAALILVMATQLWWASFGLAGHQAWTFAAFGIVLVQTTLLYMLAALVLPDFAVGEPRDLRAHYDRERRPFFGVLLAMLAASFGKEVLIEGRPPLGSNLIFHGIFAGLAIIALMTPRRRVHEAFAVTMAVVLTVYIARLFATLG